MLIFHSCQKEKTIIISIKSVKKEIPYTEALQQSKCESRYWRKVPYFISVFLTLTVLFFVFFNSV